MSEALDTRSAEERVSDVPRILAALGEGVREALMMHKRMGNPIAVWRAGRVEWIPPEEIPTEFPDEGE